MPDPFIDPQDLTDYLGKDVTADPGALMACDSACDAVRDIAEQDFNEAEYTDTFDGTGTDCLILGNRPITSVSSVTVDGTPVTDYVLTGNGRLIRGVGASSYGWSGRWPYGRQNVSVTYQAGYEDGEVPRSVRMVALQLAARLIVQGVATSETVGDVTMTYAGAASDLTDGELRILTKYRATRSF